MSIAISHSVEVFPQPTNMTCWSAAATMLFGNVCVGPGGAALDPSGGLKADPNNVDTFAAAHGLQLHYPQTWTVSGLADLMHYGPLMAIGALPSLHAIVIGGMNGDGTAGGTTLTVYDPWPPTVGRIYNVTYDQLLSNFPMATVYLLHR